MTLSAFLKMTKEQIGKNVTNIQHRFLYKCTRNFCEHQKPTVDRTAMHSYTYHDEGSVTMGLLQCKKYDLTNYIFLFSTPENIICL